MDKITAKTKCVVYGRTSIEKNANGDSLPRQKVACQSYADSNNLEIVEVFHDVITGKSNIFDRPAFTQLLEFSASNGIEVILFSDWSRFSRDLVEQEIGLRALRSMNFVIISASNGEVEENAYSTLVRQIFGSISEFQRKEITTRLMVARARKKAENGKCEGRKSYKELNPELVRQAKRLRRKNPKNGRVRSLRKVADELATLGYVNAKGGVYNAKCIKSMLEQ